MPRVKCHSCGSHDVMRVIADDCPRGELRWEWLCFDCKARRPAPGKESKPTVEVDGVMMTKFQGWAVERVRSDVASWHRIGRTDPTQYELVRFKVTRDERYRSGDVEVEAVVSKGGDLHWVYVHDITIRPRGKMTAYDYNLQKRVDDPKRAYRLVRE